jgi:hypothetical protein
VKPFAASGSVTPQSAADESDVLFGLDCAVVLPVEPAEGSAGEAVLASARPAEDQSASSPHDADMASA